MRAKRALWPEHSILQSGFATWPIAAARLLRKTAHSVEDIAAETGWTCRGRFGAAFRERLGRAPSAYRGRS